MNIESGIPIPNRRHYKPRSELGEAIRKMKVGESLHLRTEEQKESARSTMRYYGMRYMSRAVEDGWRIWRTK